MNTSIRIVTVVAFLLFLLLVRMVIRIGPERGPADRFLVLSIIDGDTVEMVEKERLRLLGIDAPEVGEPFYDSARTALRELTQGKSLEIKFSQRRRDNYGRLLGYAYTDTLFVNRQLVRLGLALVYPHRDNLKDTKQMNSLFAAQDSAIADRLGIWSVPRVPEEFYLVTPRGLRFHRPTCQFIDPNRINQYIKIYSREEAFRAGYSPCRECRP
jgi:micrococcal nuclease